MKKESKRRRSCRCDTALGEDAIILKMNGEDIAVNNLR